LNKNDNNNKTKAFFTFLLKEGESLLRIVSFANHLECEKIACECVPKKKKKRKKRKKKKKKKHSSSNGIFNEFMTKSAV